MINSQVSRASLATFLVLGFALSACSAAKKVADELEDGSTTPAAPAEIAAFAGIWADACVASSAINGVASWRKKQVSISSDGTGTMTISFHSNASCNSTLIWMYTPVTFTYDSDTGSPANGKKFIVSAAGSQSIQSQSASASTHLNSGGAGCSYSMFAMGVSGLSTNGGFTCSGDSRFNMASVAGAQGTEVVFVKNSATSVSATAMVYNMPSDAIAAASTSVSLTKQ